MSILYNQKFLKPAHTFIYSYKISKMSKFLFAMIVLLLPFVGTAQTGSCVSGYDTILSGSTYEKLDYINTYKNCEGLDFTFPINFVVVTNNGSAQRFTSYRAMQEIVFTLNLYFAAQDSRITHRKKKLVNFELKSYTNYNTAAGIGGRLFNTLSRNSRYLGDVIQDQFNSEPNTVMRDPEALNIYIYDSGQDGDLGENRDGHGRFNNGEPYILLDYHRINKRINAAEEHEMGHAFGLTHICNSMIKDKTQSSNIMTSQNKYPCAGGIVPDSEMCQCEAGKTGKRDIGFTPEQAKVILENAVKIHGKLNL